MTSDDLGDRLRAADPAAELAPLGPDRVTRLLETTMTTTLDKPPARPRHRRMFAVAAAVVAAATAGTALAIGGGHEPARPAQPTVTRLVNAGGTAKCAAPSAATLAGAPLAFAGTAERIDQGVVTLKVTRLYAGPASDLVEVRQASGASEALIGATLFETGRGYLIAAADGRALACGYSGLATPELQALYDEAF